MAAPSRRLGEFLVERGSLTRDALEDLLAREEREGVPLPRLLAGSGLVDEKDLVAAVAHQVGVPFVDLSAGIDPMVDGLVPAELAHRHLALGVSLDGDALVVAMANPGDADAIRALADATGCR